jgi:hypothetical protein
MMVAFLVLLSYGYKVDPEAQKAEMSSALALTGKPKRSSSQKDLHSPVANEPAVVDMIDLILRINWRSRNDNWNDVYQPRLGQISSKMPPFIRSMMINSLSSHSMNLSAQSAEHGSRDCVRLP